jgi:hypothetical protein
VEEEANKTMTNEQLEMELRSDLAAFTRRADLWSLASKVEHYIEWSAAEAKRLKAVREKVQADLETQLGAKLPDRHSLVQLAVGTIFTAEEDARDLHKRLVSILHGVQDKIAAWRSEGE